ncbi:hypothetical protein ASE14_07955 [Agromyces sp. Root81]|uniref:DUF2975 domain-containing protein n=1 Tax=Agromyces sp. Root81 TaxID=1736601 RepID=UPI0006FCD3D9|nr:DUF2975 domain-containing protein [Agromyces sp. Root81]KRC60887.1 hypothetical protein ASE14_07955 [Agromyces sp. Root81]
MTTTTNTYRPSRTDIVGMWAFLGAGVVIAGGAVAAAVLRIIEVLPNQDVQVAARFSDTVAEAPIGPDGAALPVILDRAMITAESLPAASLVALVIEQVVAALTIVVVVTCLVLLSRSVMRGQVFSRRNTRLVTTAGFTGLIGFAAAPFFGNMAANGAFATLSDGTFDNVVMSVELTPLILIAFVAAMAGVVFAIGDRLQRDTEGLV